MADAAATTTEPTVDAAATSTDPSLGDNDPSAGGADSVPRRGHRWLTSDAAGAIAVVEVLGDPSGLEPLLGRALPPAGTHALRRIGSLDDCVCLRLAGGFVALMPHGGTALRRAITQALCAAGYPESPAAPDHWPEAAGPRESAALCLLARAASPLAIGFLLAQSESGAAPDSVDEREQVTRLRRLIEPPTVVLVGAPNAGKSTLTNALAGRDVSIVWHEPGSTRDWIAVRINLHGLVVDWIDTPGIRHGAGEIEALGMELAHRRIAQADLVVAIAEPGGDWPQLDRPPDLRVRSKSDLAPQTAEAAADLSVCARTGAGLSELAQRVRDALVHPEDLTLKLSHLESIVSA